MRTDSTELPSDPHLYTVAHVHTHTHACTHAHTHAMYSVITINLWKKMGDRVKTLVTASLRIKMEAGITAKIRAEFWLGTELTVGLGSRSR